MPERTGVLARLPGGGASVMLVVTSNRDRETEMPDVARIMAPISLRSVHDHDHVHVYAERLSGFERGWLLYVARGVHGRGRGTWTWTYVDVRGRPA